MFSRDRDEHHESGARGGIVPSHTASSLCYFKGTSPPEKSGGRGINISGVDFWHAVEFSRNGRFLCTHPLGLSSGRFPSVLRFRLYQIFSRPDFLGAFQVFALAFPFPAVPTLSDPFGVRFPVGGICLGLPAFACRPFDIHYVSRSSRQLIIEFRGLEFGHAGTPKFAPVEGK
jgi:hypothetical protein